MLLPALDALDYLHGHGMVHGNIKPANIMAVGDELKLSSAGFRPMGESEESTESGNAYDPPENVSSSVLRVVLKLHDVVMTVSAAHEMALRTSADPANVLHRLDRHGDCPMNDDLFWRNRDLRQRLRSCRPGTG